MSKKEKLMETLNGLYAIPQYDIENIPKIIAREKIIELNDQIEKYLKEIGYDENAKDEYDRPLIKLEPVESLNKKAVLFEKDKRALLQEGVIECGRKFELFLDKYHLGYCHSFFLKDSGLIEIEISCMIHKSFIKENEVSAQKYFDEQINNLKRKGIEFFGEEYKIIANERNFNTIQELLVEIEAKHVEFDCDTHSRNKITKPLIDKIKFCVWPTSILKFDFDKVFEIEENKEFLTKDELSKITTICKEIASSIGTMESMPSLINLCGKTLNSYYYSLCSTFKIETTLSKKYENSFIEEREKNRKIFKKEEELGKKISGEEIVDGIKKIKDEFNKYTIENIGFTCEEIKIGKYKSVNIILRAISSECSRFFYEDENMEIKFINEQEMKDKFDCTGTFDREDLYVIDNDKNRKTINELLRKRYPNMEFVKYENEIHYKTNEPSLKNIHMSVRNILDLI